MLALSRKEIEAHAKANKLKWVEDESNADTRRDRNFLRHRVLPVIGQAFPGYRATLARAAGHPAEASLILNELAEADAKIAVTGNKRVLAELRRIGVARTKNLVRWLLLQQGDAAPEADRLQRLSCSLPAMSFLNPRATMAQVRPRRGSISPSGNMRFLGSLPRTAMTYHPNSLFLSVWAVSNQVAQTRLLSNQVT